MQHTKKWAGKAYYPGVIITSQGLTLLFGGPPGAGSRDKLENEDGTVKHHCLSVAASNISPLEPNMDPEVTPHKSGNEPELIPTETLSSVLRDEDELFLLSLLPSMKGLIQH